MATTYTANVRLQKPAAADRHWDVPLNSNADYLDGLAAIGGLAVSSLESPSASLSCRIAAGTYLKANGTVGTYAGGSLALPASETSYVWLTDAGVPGSGTAWPSTPYLPLAQVQVGPSTILQVVDARVPYQSVGANATFVSKAGDTISGALQVTNPSSGAAALSVDPVNGLIGFFGAAPAAQVAKVSALTDSTGGTSGTTVANVGTSFSQATLNNNFASLAATINALIAALKRHGLMSS
jgi:hypothetical protein